MIPSFLIKCPNHNEQFEGIVIDKSQTKGHGICPVSQCIFYFSLDPDKNKKTTKYTKTGIPIPSLIFEGGEGVDQNSIY